MKGVGGGSRGIGLRRDALGSYTIVDRSPSRQSFTIVGDQPSADVERDAIAYARALLDKELASKPESFEPTSIENVKLLDAYRASTFISDIASKFHLTPSVAQNYLYLVLRQKNLGLGKSYEKRSSFATGSGKHVKIGPFTVYGDTDLGHERIGRLGRIGRVGIPNSMWAYRHDIKATSNPNLSPMDPFPIDFALNQKRYLRPPRIEGDDEEKL